MRLPRGSWQTTTLIGGRCTGCEALSRPVLIAREASLLQGPRVHFAPFPSLFLCFVLFSQVLYCGGVAAGPHLYPFRTEPLSPPSPMVLAFVGRESRQPPCLFWEPRADHVVRPGLLPSPPTSLSRPRPRPCTCPPPPCPRPGFAHADLPLPAPGDRFWRGAGIFSIPPVCFR